MRTIKFRGFVAELGKFVYGDLLLNNGHPIIVIQVERSYIGTTYAGAGSHWHIETPAYKVKPETVGEFTGLHDKNGKEIYEGDIVRQEKWVSVGKYAPSIGVIKYKSVGFTCECIGDWHGSNADLNGNAEIIGNIYENTELL